MGPAHRSAPGRGPPPARQGRGGGAGACRRGARAARGWNEPRFARRPRVARRLRRPAEATGLAAPAKMTRGSVSAVVVTLNEEERLRACLENLTWADELVVVDAESSDKTGQIAREFTDRVWVRPWPGFAAQKNFALEQATSDWILSVDADEEVSPELREEIRAVLGRPGEGADGYRVPRRNIFWGRWVRHGGLYPDWQLPVFPPGRGRFVGPAVHESGGGAGAVGGLRAPPLHRSHRGGAGLLAPADRDSPLAARAGGRSRGPARPSAPAR